MAKQATHFEYSSYTYSREDEQIRFSYRMHFADGEALDFVEVLRLPTAVSHAQVPEALLNKVLQTAHVLLGLSYYKTYCPKEVQLSYSLTKTQADFFTTVYQKGLGELRFKNNLKMNNSPVFPYNESLSDSAIPYHRQDRSLVGIGGGKDSIVVAELLQQHQYPIEGLVLETQKPYPVVDAVLQELRLGGLKIKREMDPQLFEELPDSFDGHIPVSALYASIGLLAAVLYDYRYIVVGNEYSSSFGNTEYEGEEINHQWSKSQEFEQLFQDYCFTTITPDIIYYSLLRPLHEIRIVREFVKYPPYFKLFSSCNRNFSITHGLSDQLWCGECPKCLFIFLMLSAFLEPEKLVDIFGKNLYENRELQAGFADVLGFGDMKPFDCVGTFEEAQAALSMAAEKHGNTYIVKEFLSKIENSEKLIAEVFRTQPTQTIPARFMFLGMENCALLGYARENKSVHEYLQAYCPELKVTILDQTEDPDYLGKQHTFDIVVRTPGLPKTSVTAHATTATNIFFSHVRFSNTIVGITGTKGKSTTAMLTYEMLKQGGKKVVVYGNMGKPALSGLQDAYDPETIFVLELSSYQLDDCMYSPHIAVVLNLDEDHIPYHGSVEEYHKAKKNIIAHQTTQDVFVYNKDDGKVREWAGTAIAQTVLFEAIAIPEKTKLLGVHNEVNIRAAATVARVLGVVDKDIQKTIQQFKPLEHRLELVGTFHDIIFYNDALATTPEAAIAAIQAVGPVGTIFLGGEDRGYDFTELERVVRDQNITNIVLFPDSGERMFADRAGLNILETRDMQAAVKFAYKHTSKHTACLLATASPSFSVWKSYEEKGNLFKQFVKELGKK